MLENPSNGPTIIQNDPNPYTKGINSNHYLLDTTGKEFQQYINWQGTNIKPLDEYVLKFWHKMLPDSGTGATWQVNIAYYDSERNYLGQYTLYENDGTDAPTWVEATFLINYKEGYKRYSGRDETGNKHEVPADTHSFRFSFALTKNPGYDDGWKLDDFYLYRGTIPAGLGHHERYGYNGVPRSWIGIRENSGISKIRRLGMFKYEFATSRQKNRLAHIYDIGGKAFINPQAMSRGITGTIENRNANGTILGTFTPKGGVKRTKTITMMCTKEQLEYLEDLASSHGLVGMIDPQCEWSEYVISPGSMNFNVIQGVTDNPNEYHWTGTMQMEET
jgi:hypothetical protein